MTNAMIGDTPPEFLDGRIGLTRACPFNSKSRCNVPIAEPCSNCKVWQEAREKAHENLMEE